MTAICGRRLEPENKSHVTFWIFASEYACCRTTKSPKLLYNLAHFVRYTASRRIFTIMRSAICGRRLDPENKSLVTLWRFASEYACCRTTKSPKLFRLTKMNVCLQGRTFLSIGKQKPQNIFLFCKNGSFKIFLNFRLLFAYNLAHFVRYTASRRIFIIMRSAICGRRLEPENKSPDRNFSLNIKKRSL